MARAGKFRPAPIAVALTLYDVWRRLPPKQRQQVLLLARRHGPTVAGEGVPAPQRPPPPPDVAPGHRYEAVRADGASAARTIRSCSRRCAVG